MNYNKKILICGLPGSGKTTLAEPLAKLLGAVWINADNIRTQWGDWDFSPEGRTRQAQRMRNLSNEVTKDGKIVVADFICPTNETRKEFDADFIIWMDTIKLGRYDDTNAMFENPTKCDFIVTDWGDNTPDILKEIIEKEFTLSEFSVFADLKRDRKGSQTAIDIDKEFDDTIKEIWESDYPTRTDIRNIENETNIVPIFGDSFLFCSGLPREYELGTLLRKENSKVLFPNFSKPGASNNSIVNRIEQWTNDDHSKKTKTIIIGLSSIYRFDYYIDSEYPESIDAENSVHTNHILDFDISPGWEVDYYLDSVNDSVMAKRLRKSLELARNGFLSSQTTYANVYFKNLETIIRRIDWITKQRKWNIIFVKNASWHDSIHKVDIKVMNKYIENMDSMKRRCRTIEMQGGEEGNVIDHLSCRHWGLETTKSLVKEIKKEYDVL